MAESGASGVELQPRKRGSIRASVSSTVGAAEAGSIEVISPGTAYFSVKLLIFGVHPNFPWSSVLLVDEPDVSYRPLRRWVSRGLSGLSWLYSAFVITLITALWIRGLAFSRYRNAPAEQMAYGCLYLCPILAFIRGVYVYSFRRDHETHVWDLVDQENAEMATIQRAADAVSTAAAAAEEALQRATASPASNAAGSVGVGDKNVDDDHAVEHPDTEAPDTQQRYRSDGSMVRMITLRNQEMPGIHHSRKRFLSLAWSTIDFRYSLISLMVITLCWLPVNLHLFRPLFTGDYPTVIDWLADVPPDDTDDRMMNAFSVSGYAFLLMLGNFYQMGTMLTCQNVQCLIAGMIATRSERLRKRAKQARKLPAAGARVWRMYLQRWTKRVDEDTTKQLFAPLAARWLELQATLVSLFAVIFFIVLVKEGGSTPKIAIFITATWQMGFFAFYAVINDKRRAMLKFLHAELETGPDGGVMKLRQPTVVDLLNAKGQKLPPEAVHGSDELDDGDATQNKGLGAAPSTEVLVPSTDDEARRERDDDGYDDDHDGRSTRGSSVVSDDTESTVTSEQTDVRSPEEEDEAKTNGNSGRVKRQVDPRRASLNPTAKYGVLQPSTLVLKLYPVMVIACMIISVFWIGVVLMRSWLNYLECVKDLESSGFLVFDFSRCSEAEFRQMTIEAAFTSYVRSSLPTFPSMLCRIFIIDDFTLLFLLLLVACSHSYSECSSRFGSAWLCSAIKRSSR